MSTDRDVVMDAAGVPAPAYTPAHTPAPAPVPVPIPAHASVAQIQVPNPMAGFVSEFDDRVGNHEFQDGNKGWGYLPQVNEWAAKHRYSIQWEVTRVGGAAHQPEFEAYPIWCGQHLKQYTIRGPSKQATKEASARAMALSGHC